MSTYVAIESTGTWAAQLARRLPNAVATRVPAGTMIGRQIRDVIRDAADHGELDPRTAALLTIADISQQFAEVIADALATGTTVVTDSSIIGAIAHLAGGHDLTIDELIRIANWAVGGTLDTPAPGLWPTVVVIDQTVADAATIVEIASTLSDTVTVVQGTVDDEALWSAISPHI